METGEEREGSRGFSVTTLILIRAAFLFADLFLLYLIAGKKTGKGEKATGWWSRAYAAGLVRSRPGRRRSQEGEVSIYGAWLFFVCVLPDECSGIYSFLLAGGVGLHRSSTWSPFSNGNILQGGSKDDVVGGLMLNCWLIIGAMSDD